MFLHNKRLQYTVRVAEPNPGLANLLLEQFGGAQGELAAASRYFTQAPACAICWDGACCVKDITRKRSAISTIRICSTRPGSTANNE
jgi:Mn-containing catalase